MSKCRRKMKYLVEGPFLNPYQQPSSLNSDGLEPCKKVLGTDKSVREYSTLELAEDAVEFSKSQGLVPGPVRLAFNRA